MRRTANILALLWTLGLAAFFLLVPVYGRTSSARTISPDGTATHVVSSGHVGLLAVSGWSALIPLTIPVLLCLVPLLLQARKAQRRALAAAVLGIGALVLLGAATIGLFYVPAVVALVVALAHTRGRSRCAPAVPASSLVEARTKREAAEDETRVMGVCARSGTAGREGSGLPHGES